MTKDGVHTTARDQVYRVLYERRRASKQEIAKDAHLSLPTVTSCLASLLQEGLIARGGTYPSTGGRPAVAYELVSNARVAVGVELVANHMRIAAVDLYGSVMHTCDVPMAFEQSETYLTKLGVVIQEFVDAAGCTPARLLGVTIAIQGIVEKGRRVVFGGLLGADNVSLTYDDFARHVPYTLRFVHDAEAAAYAELWRHKELEEFAYLSLNNHLGSALVLAGELHKGGSVGAGVLEHTVLYPDGSTCYCGNRGCAETVLGAQALEQRAGVDAPTFFERLRAGDAACVRLWDAYLADLALLVHNVRMTLGCAVVLGGRLERFMNDADLRTLRMRARACGALATPDFRLVRGQFGDHAAMVGAALLLVDDFLETSLEVRS